MKRLLSPVLVILALAAVFTFSCTSRQSREAQKIDFRYFDHAEAATGQIRLAILYPSIGSLQAVVKLKERQIFTPENLLVVGVFHARERSDYQRSAEWVQENNIDWIRFHRLEGDLNPGNLFEPNSLSAEFKKIIGMTDGIIFFGGADIPPAVYGEKTELLTGISTPMRHYLELSFAFHLLGGRQNTEFSPLLELTPEYPVLAICLGEQTLNVAAGGTMIQDIWSEKYGKRFVEDVIEMPRDTWHNNPVSRIHPEQGLIRYNLHPIRLLQQEKFISELGFSPEDTPFIVSSHHQAAEELGMDIRAIATSMDGEIIEAIDHERFPNVLGIQFHPEFPMIWDPEEAITISPSEGAFNILTFLKENPPSHDFHKKIWTWFASKLEAYHKNR